MKTLPNKITVLRMLLVPVYLLLAYTGHMYIAFAVFAVASISDFVDGYLARKYHVVSVFGKFMDPLADKILVLSAMCFLVEKGLMPGWAVAVVLFREFAVSGLRLIAAEKSIVLAAGWSGKVKTASTMVALCVLMLFPTRILCIIATVLIVATTLYSGIEYFVINWKLVSDNTKNTASDKKAAHKAKK